MLLPNGLPNNSKSNKPLGIPISILEETLIDVMYELPGKNTLSKIHVTEQSIDNKNKFIIYDKNNTQIDYDDLLSESA